ncbi:MAG: nitrous oxide-stimulated promoter family protein [bacterium]|nr:nitrous oxide-stimulated promoter family protein [bacterium]
MKSTSPDKQLQMLTKFIEVYCSKTHSTVDEQLCDECSELLSYASDRLARCPLDPKPKCKDCHVHCYDEAHREKIKEVMKFSGMYFVKRGRLDWLVKYFIS